MSLLTDELTSDTATALTSRTNDWCMTRKPTFPRHCSARSSFQMWSPQPSIPGHSFHSLKDAKRPATFVSAIVPSYNSNILAIRRAFAIAASFGVAFLLGLSRKTCRSFGTHDQSRSDRGPLMFHIVLPENSVTTYIPILCMHGAGSKMEATLYLVSRRMRISLKPSNRHSSRRRGGLSCAASSRCSQALSQDLKKGAKTMLAGCCEVNWTHYSLPSRLRLPIAHTLVANTCAGVTAYASPTSASWELSCNW